eukprot:554705-Prymnesium_polylepis.1
MKCEMVQSFHCNITYPGPAPNRTETVPCRAVPCRAVCRVVPCRAVPPSPKHTFAHARAESNRGSH